jgi:predicted methyltransferase
MLTSPSAPLVRHRAGLGQLRASTAELYRVQAPEGGNVQCGACGGLGFRAWHTACALPETIAARPAAAAEIDQCHLDEQSLRRRVEAITVLRPVSSSRIAFVGDDDLAAVALLHNQIPARLLLLDVDERIHAALAGAARRHGAGKQVASAHLNLTDTAALAEVMDREAESYDLVVTDPPYATDGMRLFTGVAMHLTAFGGEVHIAVPALAAESWSDDLLIEVQGDLISSGFLIERVIPGAFTYLTSDVVSSLVIARRLAGTRLAPLPAPRDGRFYTTRASPNRLPEVVSSS